MLRTYDQLSKVINKMVEQGVLKKTEPSEPVVEDTAH
jgi:polyhydroxyalkanoate synthesis regulator phasin